MNLLLALLLLATAPASVQELRVCADPNNLPFSNARREGFENRLVEQIASDLGMKVRYTWWAQQRGNVRQTLNAERCDVIPGVGSTLEMLGTTRPYYRSTYMFVTRSDRKLALAGLDDPRLKKLRVGVQMIGDDGSNTPPAHALARRGIIGNVRGYMVYGDYSRPEPQARIIEAMARDEVDVAIVWGPVAGFFARRSPVQFDLVPVTPRRDGPLLPMEFDVSMGVRKGDQIRRRQLDDWLAKNRQKVNGLLREFGIPVVQPSQ